MYFLIFNKQGNVIYEYGKQPDFLYELIPTLEHNRLKGIKTIRDNAVVYEVHGSKIFLMISKEDENELLIFLIKNYFNNTLDYEKNEYEFKSKSKKKNKSKSRKWEEKGDERVLDYSTSSVVDIPETQNKKYEFKKKFGFFKNTISIEELKMKMETHLISKNVNSQISKRLCNDLYIELENKKITEKIFKDKMKNVLSKMIEKINQEEMLKDIKNVIKKEGIYSFCFVGVNGVGKSTSLAKITFWLIRNGFKVYIAACDTFRAGAIEQLKVHVKRFRDSGHQVGFYESGYNTDDATVASNAIKTAKSEKYDVILIDTAGRMHNNKNLMSSLTKLMKINNPNHIIFVGEALVGNDSVDHISEFNRSIKNGVENRKIDSLFVTKVDTVDDKIGQILNMTVFSGAPVLFIGTGQTNSDVMELNVDYMVDSLLN